MADSSISGVRGGRLRGTTRFSEAYRRGRTWGNKLLVLKVLVNGEEQSYWGFAVAKRLGGAVDRNRVRRQLREMARQFYIKSGLDVVVVAREAAAGVEFDELARALRELLRRAGVLTEA